MTRIGKAFALIMTLLLLSGLPLAAARAGADYEAPHVEANLTGLTYEELVPWLDSETNTYRDLEAKLTALEGYSLPATIKVEKVFYEYDETIGAWQPTSSETLVQGVGYNYNSTTGYLTLFLSAITMSEGLDGHPFLGIRIGDAGEQGYAGTMRTITAEFTHVTSIPAPNSFSVLQGYVVGDPAPTTPYTCMLVPLIGYDLPAQIEVRKTVMPFYPNMVPTYDLAGEIEESQAAALLINGTGYTYDSATGAITIPVETLADMTLDDGNARGITITAAGVPQNVTSYTVTFDSRGGLPVPPKQTVQAGGLLSEPTAPTRAGYAFGGWYTAGGARWNFAADAVTQSVTLYAGWSRLPADEPPERGPRPNRGDKGTGGANTSAQTSGVNAQTADVPKTGGAPGALAWGALLAGASGLIFALKRKRGASK